MRITIEDILPKLNKYIEHDGYVMTHCCFHSPDIHPSLAIYNDGYHCYACGARGSLYKLWKELQGGNFLPTSAEVGECRLQFSVDLDALKLLCDEAHNLLVQYPHPLQEYLKRRGVKDRIIPQRLGYWRGFYTVPCYDENEMFMGVVMRASPHLQQETGARFNIPKGQPAIFYVPDWELALSNNYLCVVFGMFDALALCELGIPSGTSTSGKDSTSAEMLEWCRKHILIIPDEGEEDTARKLLTKLGWRGKVLDIDYPSDCKDPADMLEHGYGIELKQMIEKEARNE